MKEIFFILMAMISFLSCNATEKNEKVAGETEQATDTKTEPAPVESKATAIYLTKAEFLDKVFDYETHPNEWNYKGDRPCIVDFYASWCGPCKKIAPILEELAAKYDGKIYIYKIDTDKEPELAAKFGIRSIPSLLFIPLEGKPQMGQGAMPKSDLEEAIKEVLLVK